MKRKISIMFTLFVCLALTFTSCTISDRDIGISLGGTSYRYENSDRYSVGNASLTAPVKELDISWISGDVIIEYHEGNDVILEEDATGTLDKAEKMHYLLDGTTLYIKYLESGIFRTVSVVKKLTVKLPADTMLSDLTVETVSADLEMRGTQIRELDVETVSGNVDILEANISESVQISGVSGKISGTFSARELSLESVSGNISVSLSDIREISVENVSGNIMISSDCAPEEMDIETVSGDVTLLLPKESEFSLKFNSASGELESDFAMTKKGKEYICGNGGNEYDMNTVSGNVTISYKNE